MSHNIMCMAVWCWNESKHIIFVSGWKALYDACSMNQIILQKKPDVHIFVEKYKQKHTNAHWVGDVDES